MNARPTATDRLARLLALVPWVAARPEGVPVAEVCARFQVTPSELLADIDTVMMIGVHPFTPDTMIEAWVDDTWVTIHYADAFAHPLRLTADEAVALITAARGLSAIPGAESDAPLQRAITKLDRVIGAGAAAGIDVDLGSASGGVFSVLDDGLRDRTQVEIDYPDSDGERTRIRRVEPSRLFSSAGHWYVSGWCHHAGGPRIFRVDRILAARNTGEPFVQSGPDAAGSVDFDETLPQVTLEVDRPMAWLLDAVPALERVETETTVQLRLAIGSPTWLARLLLQLGPAGRVLDSDSTMDPAALTRAEARRVLDRYR